MSMTPSEAAAIVETLETSIGVVCMRLRQRHPDVPHDVKVTTSNTYKTGVNR